MQRFEELLEVDIHPSVAGEQARRTASSARERGPDGPYSSWHGVHLSRVLENAVDSIPGQELVREGFGDALIVLAFAFNKRPTSA